MGWQDSDFKTEAESLRFFYADPERDKGPDESCSVAEIEPRAVTGQLMHSGGIWYRPDFRGRKIGEILPRLARAYSYATWNIDQAFGIATEANVKKKFHLRNGYRDVVGSVVMRYSPTYPVGDLRLALCRMRNIDIIDDIFGFLMDFDSTEVDVEILNRRA